MNLLCLVRFGKLETKPMYTTWWKYEEQYKEHYRISVDDNNQRQYSLDPFDIEVELSE